MEHFTIVKSLVRVALAQGERPVQHQVERLAAALRKVDDKDAAALEQLLTRTSQSKLLTPSRLTKSLSGMPSGGERMSRTISVPVDRETSAPLATVIFPDDNTAMLPIFPQEIAGTISTLLLEWEHHDQIRQAGLEPSLTCLVYGPPGTGKTTFALWLAKSLGLPAVVARLDGLISSYLGTTARNVGALFSFANRYECVLVLDEFDAIAKLRDDPNEVGEIKRVVNALLQNIDSRDGRGITIGLTNHEALLDPAVWRRFDVQFSVPLPGAQQRQEIATRSLGNETPHTLADAKLLAWVSGGLSGAEIGTMCEKFRKYAIITAVQDLPPVAVVARLASTTSAGVDRSRVADLGDEAAAVRALTADPDISFSQGELAYLLGVSTKTVSRRINDIGNEGVKNGE